MRILNNMVRGIIIGHSSFAQAMFETAERIVGEQQHVAVISNTGYSGDALNERIAEVLDEDRAQDTLIFLDLPGGSCTISCYKLLKKDESLNIISGVNLPMLIEFFLLREKHTAEELVPILMKKGKDNIIQLRCRK
jgi:mannose/fructose-specific phosphotransferase system component IIA